MLSHCPKLQRLHGFPAPGSQCWWWKEWVWWRSWYQETRSASGWWFLDSKSTRYPHFTLPLRGRHRHTLWQTAEEKPLVRMARPWHAQGRHTVPVSSHYLTTISLLNCPNRKFRFFSHFIFNNKHICIPASLWYNRTSYTGLVLSLQWCGIGVLLLGEAVGQKWWTEQASFMLYKRWLLPRQVGIPAW